MNAVLGGRWVAVLFAHTSFPGVRFGRFPPGLDGRRDPIHLMEQIETGALDRMMRDQPAADEAGIIWTTWAAPTPVNRANPRSPATDRPLPARPA